MEAALKIISKINTTILNPIILLLFAVALVYFVFGVLQYLVAAKSDPAAIQKGASHMGWGLFGMFVMISIFSFMKIIINSFPVDSKTQDSVNKVLPLN